jgi:hypothetical protein
MHRRSRAAVLVAVVSVASLVAVAPRAAADPPSADLSVAVSHAPGSGLTGEDVAFTLTASNAGPDAAEGTVVGMSFQYPFLLKSASAPGGTCTGGAETSSVICTLGTVASGDSAAATIVVTPYYAGVFTVPVAVASDTADPDTADHSATDTIIVQQGPTTFERATDVIYQDVLGRHASDAEQAYWGNRWQQVQYSGAPRVPLAIILSAESRAIRIREAYSRILGRPASDSDVAYWSGRMAHGLTIEGLEVNLVASREFFAPVADQVNQGITNVYSAILRRAPSASELTYAQAHLSAHAPLATLAIQLQYGNEGRNRVLDERFDQVLHRAPTGLDLYVWRYDLLHGATSDSEWAKLYTTGEFLEQFPPDYGPFEPAGIAAPAGQHITFSAAPLAHLGH